MFWVFIGLIDYNFFLSNNFNNSFLCSLNSSFVLEKNIYQGVYYEKI